MSGGAGLTRAAVTLTQKGIDALRSAPTPYRVPDLRCKGLAIRVSASGVKTWDLAFRIKGGTVRRVSLGQILDLPLEKARERANAITGAARSGRDLLADEDQTRNVAAARITVDELITQYVKRKVAGRLRTAKEIESRLRRALCPIAERPADDVRRRDLRGLFDQVLDEGYPREAEKRRQTVGAMFRWALAQDRVQTDPTAGLSAYDPGRPRERILTDDEVHTLLNGLDTAGFPAGHANIIRLQLFTGARCSEVGGMTVEEIDRVAWTWTLPKARSKNGRQRVTPVVGQARKIIEALLHQTASGPFFRTEGGKVVTSANMGKSLQFRRERLGLTHFTTHDLRRTAATRMVELGGSYEIVAAVLGQEVGGRETRTLQRNYVWSDFLERKTAMLESWDRRLQGIASGVVAPSNVTVLRETKKNYAA